MRKEHGEGWGARGEGESNIILFQLAYFKINKSNKKGSFIKKYT